MVMMRVRARARMVARFRARVHHRVSMGMQVSGVDRRGVTSRTEVRIKRVWVRVRIRARASVSIMAMAAITIIARGG